MKIIVAQVVIVIVMVSSYEVYLSNIIDVFGQGMTVSSQDVLQVTLTIFFYIQLTLPCGFIHGKSCLGGSFIFVTMTIALSVCWYDLISESVTINIVVIDQGICYV